MSERKIGDFICLFPAHLKFLTGYYYMQNTISTSRLPMMASLISFGITGSINSGVEFYQHSSAEELPGSGEYDTSCVSIAVRKYLRKLYKQKERFVLAS